MPVSVNVLTESSLAAYGVTIHSLPRSGAIRAARLVTKALDVEAITDTEVLWDLYDQAVALLAEAPDLTDAEGAEVKLDTGGGLDRMTLG